MKSHIHLFLRTLVVIGMSQSANAVDATWTGLGADSLWTTTGNWSTSPVPGAGNTATFNSAGNSKTTITTAPAALFSYVFNTGAAAYTISGATTTWAVPNGGGVTINSGVSATQDLSGIQFIRPVSGSTTNFVNSGSGLLKLGTIFNSNASSPATGNALLRFVPASGATIEVISGKTVDNASTAGRTVSILLDDAGILKMAATGSFSGTDSDGNSVTIRQGTLQASSIINTSSTKSSLGTAGRIQFGKASTTNTATLDYYNATSTTTDRAFYIIDNNTAVFKVSGGASTNLAITTAVTQSAATNGGGKLTKDGAGILTLSAANTFTGDTVISNGKIALGIATALQNSAYDTTGSTGAIGLDVTGQATPTLGGLKGSVNLATAVTGYGGVSSLTLNPQSGKSNTYTGVIAEGATGMTLIKSGAGTQVLSGDNSFTGNVTVSAGTLRLAHSNALGTGTKGLQMQGTGRVLELSNNITLGSNITLNVSSNTGDGLGISNVDGTNEIQGQVNISTGNPAMNISSAAGTLTISGNITLTATARTLYLGGASANANTISGIISETGGVLPVTKQGAGNWVFTNANTYSGDTKINGGTLTLGNNLAIQNSAFDTSGAGTMVLSGTATPTFGGLKGSTGLATAISSGYGSVTGLTLNPGSVASHVYSGAVTNGSGNTTLTKSGAGTQILAGNNSYTGATNVNAGKLLINGNNPAATGAVTVATGATLGGTGTVGGATSISGTHNAGDAATNAGVGSQAFASNLTYADGSIFEWDLNASSTSTGFDTVSSAGTIAVSTTDSVFKVIFGTTALADVQNTSNAFWNTPYGTQTWNMIDIFGQAFSSGAFQSVQTSNDVSTYGSFTITGSTLTWTAVPEPTTALAGLLLTFGLLRRRRG